MARKKKPKRRLCTLDAETDPFKYNRVPKPFVWGLYMGDGDYMYFWGDDCTEQLIAFLKTQENLVIYAHNGGKFDYFYLIDYFDDETEVKIINGRISKAHLFGGKIELLDSYNIIPLPLKALEKDDIDYELMEREKREQNKPEILRYLQKDCEYLYEWVNNFEERFGRNLTLAGTALKQIKLTAYEVQNTFEEYDNLFRDFYMGGRVQCFEVGQFVGDYTYVDINSAYPTAMRENHPHGGQYLVSTKLPDNGKPYFATIEAVSRGCLPYRGDDGRLYYPNDDTVRTYNATSWEILAGLDTGTLDIKNTIKVLQHVFTANFQEYVDYWYAEKLAAKKAGDKARELFAKLMLNSGYGKFGQDGRKFEDYRITEYGDWPDGEEWKPYSNIEAVKDYQVFSRPNPSYRFYNVATAASITGYVRGFLWRSLCAVERPLYCDTDSIICRSADKLPMGDQLGEWSLECDAEEVYIAQKKMYSIKVKDSDKWKKACKGVRLTAEQIKTGVLSGRSISTDRDAPNFSLKYGPRFVSRKTDFENIEKNACQTPKEKLV